MSDHSLGYNSSSPLLAKPTHSPDKPGQSLGSNKSYSTAKLPQGYLHGHSLNGEDKSLLRGEHRVKNSRSFESLRGVLDSINLAKEKQEALLTHLVSMHCQLKANHALAMSTLQSQKNAILSEIELLSQEAVEQLNTDLLQKEQDIANKKARIKEYLEDLAEASDKLDSSARYAVYTEKHESLKAQAKRILAREQIDNEITMDWLEFPTNYFPYKISKRPAYQIAELDELSSINHGRNDSSSLIEPDKPDESDKQAAISFLFNAYRNLEEKVELFAQSYQHEGPRGPFSVPVTPHLRHRQLACSETAPRIQLSSRLTWKGAKPKLKANQIRLVLPQSTYFVVTLTPGVTSQELLEHLVSHVNMMGEHYVIGIKRKGEFVTVPAQESILKIKSIKHKQRFYLYKP